MRCSTSIYRRLGTSPASFRQLVGEKLLPAEKAPTFDVCGGALKHVLRLLVGEQFQFQHKPLKRFGKEQLNALEPLKRGQQFHLGAERSTVRDDEDAAFLPFENHVVNVGFPASADAGDAAALA